AVCRERDRSASSMSTTGCTRWWLTRRSTATGKRPSIAASPISTGCRAARPCASRALADLAWVSRAAVAHEAVVESFIAETAVLPMKLFTIFTSDERAVAHVRAERQRIAAFVKRVSNHQEWGMRVVLDRQRAAAAAPKRKTSLNASSGVA